MKTIQLEPKHFSIVKNMLKKFEVTAYVFGSRAKNTAKKLSDLPFKVDIILWNEISESFQQHIENDFILLE